MSQRKAEREQIDNFRDLAREIKADEDEAAFEEQVRRVGKAPPSPQPEEPE